MALPKDIEKIKKQATVFVIFGATGNLAQKKLFPSMFALDKSDLLPEKLKIVATSRTSHSTQKFQDLTKESVAPKDAKKWQEFSQIIKFVPSDIAENKNLDRIVTRLSEIEKKA